MTDILLFKDGERVEKSALDLMLSLEPTMLFLDEGKRKNVVMENIGTLNPDLPIRMFIFIPKFGTYYVATRAKETCFRADLRTDFYPPLHAGAFNILDNREDDIFKDRKYELSGNPRLLYDLLRENGFKLISPDEFKGRYLD